MTYEEYKANFQMPQALKETLTEEEQETHIIICFCNDDSNFDNNPENF